jgi:hypothetical protein
MKLLDPVSAVEVDVPDALVAEVLIRTVETLVETNDRLRADIDRLAAAAKYLVEVLIEGDNCLPQHRDDAMPPSTR